MSSMALEGLARLDEGPQKVGSVVSRLAEIGLKPLRIPKP